jgi:dipeptidyl aminopeptidase/acylaminoacyl peptidase
MKPLFLCALLGSLALALPAAAQTAPTPVEAFGRLPTIADAAISPDGRRVALATNQSDGQSAVLIVNLDQTSERTGYAAGEGVQLRGVTWADNERVAYLLSQTVHPGQVLPYGVRFNGRPRRIDYYRWVTVNLTTGHAEGLTTNRENPWADQGASLISPIEGDPGFARMIGRTLNLERSNAALFRVDLDSGRARQQTVFGVNADTVDFIIGRDGAVAGRLDTDRETNRWRLFTYDGETPRQLLEDVSRFGEPITIEGLLPDGRFVSVETSDAGFLSVYAINRGNAEVELLHQAENTDVSSVLHDPWTREVIGVAWNAVETEEHYFDPALQSARDAVVATAPGAAIRLVSWSQDRVRFIVYIERGLDGGAYYLFDRSASTLRLLAPRYPDLVRANLGERQSITYRARDGTRIPAYLTLPAGAPAQNLPLVLLVHGGPHARDTMDFDWWSTFLASRGYAVLQPNYRGSSGYGDAWEEAGRLQWGGLMQTDVEDGVAGLIRAGMVDQSRVCIVGASYGGYAALAGATLTPDRYRCAVSVAGVSDLGLMLTRLERQTGGDDSMISDWWRASIGDREEDRARIRSVSPLHLVDRVQIPILLIHGTDDTVVPIEQSHRMRDALQSAGRQVRFVELRGDDHWLSDAPTRIQMLREVETFLAQHLRSQVSVDDSGAPAVPRQ